MFWEQSRLKSQLRQIQRGTLLLVAAFCLFAAAALNAATNVSTVFGVVTVSSFPGKVTLGSSLTYSISLANTSSLTALGVGVTNTFSGPFQAQPAAGLTVIGQTATFAVDVLPLFSTNTLTLVVTPTMVGSFTNVITIDGANILLLTLSVVTPVLPGATDVGISLAVPASLFVGDVAEYSFTLRNFGPAPASNLSVTSAAPGVVILGVAPATGVSTNSSGEVVVHGLSLTNGESLSYRVAIQPTNTGSLNISAAVTLPNQGDSNPTNNSASATLNVFAPALDQLDVSILSAQIFNHQTGLMEQVVRVTNTNGTALTNARVVLVGFTNRLYNAVGTNNGNPFVLYSGTLAPGDTVDLLLELFVPSRVPDTNFTLIAYEAPAMDLTAPPSAGPNISLIKQLGPDQVLIEFPATLNKTYLILYSDSAAFTNALKAEPSIVAPGDRVQWIDSGPPKTISPPGSNTMRFYRVLQLQP